MFFFSFLFALEKLKAAQAPSLLPDFTPDFINKNVGKSVGKSKEVRAPSPELDFIFHSNESMSSGFTHRLSNNCSNTGDEVIFKDISEKLHIFLTIFSE